MVQAIPAGDYSDTAIQNLSLGGNVTINDATLISDSGLSGSMLILGNSYQTEAIFQTNVLSQSDHFQVSSGDAGINYIPNIVQNIADISTTGAMTGPWTAAGSAELDSAGAGRLALRRQSHVADELHQRQRYRFSDPVDSDTA